MFALVSWENGTIGVSTKLYSVVGQGLPLTIGFPPWYTCHLSPDRSVC